MLLRNESVVRHSIDIKLVFDDNTCRELTIHEGEIVEISYRKNGFVRCGVGFIRQIKPYLKKSFRYNRPVESAVILLDMSEENTACVDKIELDDIIDINFVYPDCQCPILPSKPPKNEHCNCINCQCKKEDIPKPPQNNDCKCKKPHYSCLVGSALTNRGVIGHG